MFVFCKYSFFLSFSGFEEVKGVVLNMSSQRLTRVFPYDLEKLVSRFSRYSQAPLTIQQLSKLEDTPTPHHSFRFLRKEVPVRLAHILNEFKHLPKNFKCQPSVKLVKEWYEDSICEIANYESRAVSDSAVVDFSASLQKLADRHVTTVQTLSRGLMELRDAEGEENISPVIQFFFNRVHTKRIGVRLLIKQHLSLFGPTSRISAIGLFEPEMNVKNVVEDAARSASVLCKHVYSDHPHVKINAVNVINPGKSIKMSYASPMLYRVIYELVTNSMRATMEKYGPNDLPSIDIDIVKGKEDLCIRVSDLGGGMTLSEMSRMYQYHYTTAPIPDENSKNFVIAGHGYGLPIARVYAQYFGGDLKVTSIDGYGTQGLVYLKHLGS